MMIVMLTMTLIVDIVGAQVRVDFVDTSLLPPVEGECSLQVIKLWIFTLKRITEYR